MHSLCIPVVVQEPDILDGRTALTKISLKWWCPTRRTVHRRTTSAKMSPINWGTSFLFWNCVKYLVRTFTRIPLKEIKHYNDSDLLEEQGILELNYLCCIEYHFLGYLMYLAIMGIFLKLILFWVVVHTLINYAAAGL